MRPYQTYVKIFSVNKTEEKKNLQKIVHRRRADILVVYAVRSCVASPMEATAHFTTKSASFFFSRHLFIYLLFGCVISICGNVLKINEAPNGYLMAYARCSCACLARLCSMCVAWDFFGRNMRYVTSHLFIARERHLVFGFFFFFFRCLMVS